MMDRNMSWRVDHLWSVSACVSCRMLFWLEGGLVTIMLVLERCSSTHETALIMVNLQIHVFTLCKVITVCIAMDLGHGPFL